MPPPLAGQEHLLSDATIPQHDNHDAAPATPRGKRQNEVTTPRVTVSKPNGPTARAPSPPSSDVFEYMDTTGGNNDIGATANNEIYLAGRNHAANIRAKIETELDIFAAFCKAIDSVRNTYESMGDHAKQYTDTLAQGLITYWTKSQDKAAMAPKPAKRDTTNYAGILKRQTNGITNNPQKQGATTIKPLTRENDTSTDHRVFIRLEGQSPAPASTTVKNTLLNMAGDIISQIGADAVEESSKWHTYIIENVPTNVLIGNKRIDLTKRIEMEIEAQTGLKPVRAQITRKSDETTGKAGIIASFTQKPRTRFTLFGTSQLSRALTRNTRP
ncbi:endonuclease reverse transcriptase [Fusarium subglutinans]|uniref:Endonuclease reverse transcriptase n=1 Tax=Gibberella subglutinans TaxID=42677 RepID=A0A8H5Q1S1_GIBSU|nr:endonuclease reverse transcriptase [Fusarium subglutinans]KAF5606674.1 endonuclease reverse transcriptase [Fusarium subglutinans]